MTQRRPLISTVFAFAFLGPLIGQVVFLVLMLVAAFSADPSGASTQAKMITRALPILLFLIGVPVAYIIGFVPALVTGVMFGWVVSSVPMLARAARHWQSFVAAVIGGAMSAFACALTQNPDIKRPFGQFVAAGAIAAFAISYIWPQSSKPSKPANQTMEPTRDT